MTLHKADNVFLAYYYRVVLHGTYPLLTDSEVANFKKFTREFLNIAYKSNFIESGIIREMRNLETINQLSKAVRFEFAKLFKMPDRPKVLLDQLLLIKQKINDLQVEAKMTNGINPVKGYSDIPEDEVAVKVVEKAANEISSKMEKKLKEVEVIMSQQGNIAEWEKNNGKRFRMLKIHKQKGLTRDQAFLEMYGEK